MGSRIEHSNGRTATEQRSQQVMPQWQGSSTATAQLLDTLCQMKQATSLTKEESSTWISILALFPSEVLRDAILEIGLSECPFPNLGSIVAACRRLNDKRDGRTVPLDGYSTPDARTIAVVAKALRLKNN